MHLFQEYKTGSIKKYIYVICHIKSQRKKNQMITSIPVEKSFVKILHPLTIKIFRSLQVQGNFYPLTKIILKNLLNSIPCLFSTRLSTFLLCSLEVFCLAS